MSAITASTAALRNVSILLGEAWGLPVSRVKLARPGWEWSQKKEDCNRGWKVELSANRKGRLFQAASMSELELCERSLLFFFLMS